MKVVWLFLLLLSSALWLGGYAVIAVVARVARTTLEPQARVSFFRELGRSYLPIGAGALVVAFLSGAVLLSGREAGGLAIAIYVVASALVILLAVAVFQARRMTRLRQAVASGSARPEKVRDTEREGHRAALLRVLLGVLSLVLLALGSVIAVRPA